MKSQGLEAWWGSLRAWSIGCGVFGAKHAERGIGL